MPVSNALHLCRGAPLHRSLVYKADILDYAGKSAAAADYITFVIRQEKFNFGDIIREGLFVYPKTQWNMTPEEVMKALDLTEEQFRPVAGTGGSGLADRVFVVEELEVSNISSDVYFWFRAYGENSILGLKSVTWIFNEAADMELLQRDIEESLGDAAGMNTRYSLLYWDSNDTLAQYRAAN